MDTNYQSVDVDMSQQLDVLIDYSKRMLVAAKEDDWGEVAEIESKRAIAMKRFFNGENEKNIPVEMLRAALMELQVLERELVERGMAAREAMASEIKDAQVSNTAVAAYKANR